MDGSKRDQRTSGEAPSVCPGCSGSAHNVQQNPNKHRFALRSSVRYPSASDDGLPNAVIAAFGARANQAA
jgi:hypothetical protein